jgi:hypothetical protein
MSTAALAAVAVNAGAGERLSEKFSQLLCMHKVSLTSTRLYRETKGN